MALLRNSKPAFLLQTERDEILAAIKTAEINTSGEIRVFIESRCKLMEPLDHAEKIFLHLKMQNTANKNAVLIYIAYKDHDFAIYGDRGCIIKFEKTFWSKQVRSLSYHFSHKQFKQGILKCIEQVGEMLQMHFPNNGENKNELPDEIIFGK